ncbi:putative 2'-5' RNA ligase [Nitrospira sp. KM1]|uniref:RNA 2',3'-cyclic phosphodiesterase n=1 Tax=Nitrospira sp. KM1 TaxID=1936990 RepID=UPI0013A7724D|nr:RNA 2',3'-cyclic phosphodiesterase [Nitrospira sp. KM1]BCA53143.1 putative 2'-5' RNA ligase [Nitrospira sp. KM1]
MIRAFVAFEPDEATRRSLAGLQQELKRLVERACVRNVGISWTRPSSIHLTVKFLGDINEGQVPLLQRRITDAIAHHPPFHIPLERLGAFPRIEQPRVLWAGPADQWERGDDAMNLLSLHRAVESCCQALGFVSDPRMLKPHLTLARIKEGGRMVGQILAGSGIIDRIIEGATLPVEAIVLLKSELNPTGSVYTKLWDLRLR